MNEKLDQKVFQQQKNHNSTRLCLVHGAEFKKKKIAFQEKEITTEGGDTKINSDRKRNTKKKDQCGFGLLTFEFIFVQKKVVVSGR